MELRLQSRRSNMGRSKPGDIFINKRGFTLIELLIVVAIIAILAAIAIPNFLQAQVRAKVSRVHSDMRSVTTALEAYYVDHNDYIPDYYDGCIYPPRYLRRLVPLTTPVAYITSIPSDVFAEGPATSEHTLLRSLYTYDQTIDGELAYPLTFEFAKQQRGNPDRPQAHFEAWRTVAVSVGMKPEDSSRFAWALRSAGPDGISVPLWYTEADLQSLGLEYAGRVAYDPTNGTISAGQIYRTNLGQH